MPAALLAVLLSACAPASGDEPVRPREAPAVGVIAALPVDVALPPDPDHVFGDFLAAPIPVADGFSAPVSGASSCGDGCWTSDAPRTVSAPAHGRVESVGPGFLVTEHLWYDDQVKRTARFRWEGMDATVAAGATLTRGQPLGAAATLRLSALDDVGPIAEFLAGRPQLPAPQAERVLALVSHDLDRMRVYVDGAAIGTYEVGFGQADGDKEVRGDNRTPKGVYHVVYRSTGPFDGPVGRFYGGYWIKLGYPNPWDAARGVDAGLIDTDTQRAITRAFWGRRMPPQGTKLGGGIGLHGWAYEWSDEGDRAMSWGCVVLHLSDVAALYDTLGEGAMVVLF